MDFDQEKNMDVDLQQATLEMAKCYIREKKFFEKYIGNIQTNQLISSEVLKQFEQIRESTREYSNKIAAIPHFFDIMESWKVSLSGKTSLNEETLKKMNNTSSSVLQYFEKCGTMAVNIRDYIQNKGLIICDVDISPITWSLSVRCTDKVSMELCYNIFQRYSQAIRLELLLISRRFAGHALPGMYSWSDAEIYLSYYKNEDGIE